MITETSFLGLPLRTAAQRRTFVLLYYGLLVLFTVVAFARHRALPEALWMQTLVFGSMLGGIRTGGPVKAYAEPRFPLGAGALDEQPIALGLDPGLRRAMAPRAWSPLDERETAQRDRAHYQAYRIVRWTVCGAAGAYFGAWLWRPLLLEHETPVLLWLLLVFVLSLPQAVLLWTEPAPPEGELVVLPAA